MTQKHAHREKTDMQNWGTRIGQHSMGYMYYVHPEPGVEESKKWPISEQREICFLPLTVPWPRRREEEMVNQYRDT